MKSFLFFLLVMPCLLKAQDPVIIGTFYKGSLYDNYECYQSHINHKFHHYNGKLVGKLCTEAFGSELWTTDGTSEGTTILKDIIGGSDNGYIRTAFTGQNIANYNDKVYFTSFEDYQSEGILWQSEGSTESTIMFAEGNFRSRTESMQVYEGYLYFTGENQTTGEKGLFKTNGTEAGTNLVIGNEDVVVREILGFRFYDNKILFFKDLGDLKASLTSYDLETHEITVLDEHEEEFLRIPFFKPAFQGEILFTAKDGNNDKIVKTDGTQSGTVSIFDGQYIGDPDFIAYVDDELLIFSTIEYPEEITRLYSAHDTENLTCIYSPELENNIEGVKTGNTYRQISPYLFFQKEEELWRTDGTFEGTMKIFDDAGLPHKYNENLYYSNNNAESSLNSLWSFTVEEFEGQQVGSNDFEIINAGQFNSSLPGKLIFFGDHSEDTLLYHVYALDLPPNSIFNKNSRQTELSVFPNPAQSVITVPLSEDFQNVDLTVELYNVTGQRVISRQLSGSSSITIDIPKNTENGMYVLKLTAKNKSAYGKVMLKK